MNDESTLNPETIATHHASNSKQSSKLKAYRDRVASEAADRKAFRLVERSELKEYQSAILEKCTVVLKPNTVGHCHLYAWNLFRFAIGRMSRDDLYKLENYMEEFTPNEERLFAIVTGGKEFRKKLPEKIARVGADTYFFPKMEIFDLTPKGLADLTEKWNKAHTKHMQVMSMHRKIQRRYAKVFATMCRRMIADVLRTRKAYMCSWLSIEVVPKMLPKDIFTLYNSLKQGGTSQFFQNILYICQHPTLFGIPKDAISDRDVKELDYELNGGTHDSTLI